MDVARLLLGATEQGSNTLPFLLALLIMTPILVISTRRRMRNSSTANKQPQKRVRSYPTSMRERAESIRVKNASQADTGAAMLELQQYARTIQAQIDNRYQKLEKAAAHADHKIAELQRLLAQSGSNPNVAPGVDPNLDVWHTIATPRTKG